MFVAFLDYLKYLNFKSISIIISKKKTTYALYILLYILYLGVLIQLFVLSFCQLNDSNYILKIAVQYSKASGCNFITISLVSNIILFLLEFAFPLFSFIVHIKN